MVDVEKYKYEAGAVGFFVFALFVFFRGKATNEHKANEWRRAVQEVIA